MPSNDIDHRDNNRPQPGTAKPNTHEEPSFDHELIRWLPLIAANDFLEIHSNRDPAA